MKRILVLSIFLALNHALFTQVLESFSFNGSLNANGWTTHSGAIPGQFQTLSSTSDCLTSLYYSGLETSNGNRITYVAGNTEDVNKAITGISGTGYFSYLLKVTNTTGLSAVGDYFTGFGGTAGISVSIFAPRVYIKAGITPNTFQLGIQNTTGGTPTQTYSGEYPVGTTIFVVVKLNASVSPIQASLFVNPIPGAIEPAASISNSSGTNTFANFASIFLRQGGSATSGTGNLQMDEIRVGSTWESVTPACTQILTWYPDTDGDGFGGASPIIQSCCQPSGYVANNTDCDDNNSVLNPNAIWYADLDNDGFGDANSTQTSCTQPNGFVSNSTDCNDNNSQVNTLSTFYIDADNDGFGNPAISVSNCGQPAGYVANNTDCDDSNATINSSATEIADNIDNDCDGLTDEGFAILTWYLDNDQDGFGGIDSVLSILSPGANYVLIDGDCNDQDLSINPNASEICDGIDNNCDGLIDNGLTFFTYYADADLDGFGNINDSLVACSQPTSYVLNNADCDDSNASINPGATDVPVNGIDEDCNGVDAPLIPLLLGLYEFTQASACPVTSISVSNQPTGATFGNFGTQNTICSPAANVFNNSGWNLTQNLDSTEFNEFSIQASDCKTLNLDRIAFNHRCSGTGGTPTWIIRSSLDNYSSTIASGLSGNNNNVNLDDTVFLNSSFQGISQVTFRFYITGIGQTGSTWRMDNVSVYGNILSLTPQLYYADGDGDGYGNPLVDSLACSIPQNFVLDNTDCDDANDQINPLTVWYFDNDGDQIGDSSLTFVGCNSPVGYVLSAGDCDDNNIQISGPIIYYVDNDGDSFGNDSTAQSLCQNPGIGYVTLGGDCNDSDSLINPNANEICDGIDNDCDGNIDNGLNFITYYSDTDGDGFGTGNGQSLCQNPGNGFVTVGGDCNDTDDQINPSAIEICDGIDNDCDGSTDEGLNFITYYTDADNDGFGTGSTGLSFCENPGIGFSTNNQDCDDTNGQINPNATDILDNGIDENCDGVDGILIVEEMKVDIALIVPNPNNGSFKIEFKNSASRQIKMKDLNGKIIQTWNFTGSTLNVNIPEVISGYYFLEIQNNEMIQTLKFMKY
jgi:hypothetical protein